MFRYIIWIYSLILYYFSMKYHILGILSGILGAIAYGKYFWSIFHKKIQPNFYTWAIWWALSTIATIIAWKNEAWWWALYPTIMMTCNASIALIALRYPRSLSQIEKILLIIVSITLILWYTTNNDLWAITLVCVTDLIGFYFTWKKSYHYPQSEDIWSYFFWAVGLLLSFVAIESHTLTNSLYPGVLAIAEWWFVIFLLWRKNRQHLIF